MRVFAVAEPAVKSLMNRLLRENLFDEFEVRGAEINCLTRFEISGILDKSQTDGDPKRHYCTWAELRPFVYQIVKGGRRPRSLKIVFAQSVAEEDAVNPDASALFINFLYEDNAVTCTSAIAQKRFSMDKTAEAQWDEEVRQFFGRNGVTVVEL